MAMAMIMDESFLELDFSSFGYSTTTNTTTTMTSDDEHYCIWNDWSPMVDWNEISGDEVDFHRLIESIPNDYSASSCGMIITQEEAMEVAEDFKGLRLIHLLMAVAEALSGEQNSPDLARVILVRLKELVSPTNGSNMERLAAHFTDALKSLLEGTGSLHSRAHHTRPSDELHQIDVLTAFQLLQDMSPYVNFGHLTANQAILESVAHDKRVHIVDYEIMEGTQWASLMQALATRKDEPPPHLRITAVSRGGTGKRSISTVQETGQRLVSFAATLGIQFSFHHVRLDYDQTFRVSPLKLVRGEALVFNCMLHLPHSNYRSPESIASFLFEAKTLNPRLVTLVEEEVGLASDGGFVDRFMDSLHHYSAVYDSLEAGFPMHGQARALVERVLLGPRIVCSLDRNYRARDSDRSVSWGEWLGEVGYTPVSISFANHCQAKLLLGLFNDGYRVEELGNNKLVLGWKSRHLLSASVWTS